MSQGFAGYNIMDSAVTIADGANLDAFSRFRVSNPLTLFNSQFTYNLNPLLFEQITSGAGAAIAHNTTNRYATMTFAATPTGGQCYMQSYEYFTYQPGKSQLAFVTFNFEGGVADVLKFAGYSDGVNGVEFQLNGTTPRFMIYSGTGTGTQSVNQSSWNLDKLDGTGPSGYTLDLTKVQILIIDLQALYSGRVRVGFDIGGSIIYAHEFLHANTVSPPYLQTATLPIRCGMTCTATVSTTMYFLCCTVMSEGGLDEPNMFGYSFIQESGAVNVPVGGVHMLSLRPKLTFNGITNRAKLAFIDVEFFNNGNQPVYWQLCIGQAITGTTTFKDVNTTYSATEHNVLGTLSGSPAIILDEGFVPASGGAKGAVNTAVNARYPITLDAAGAHRSLGTITLKAVSLNGTQICYGTIKFREIR